MGVSGLVRKGRALRLDYATLAGFGLAIGCMLGGLLLEGGKIADVRQLTAALIVLGGTTGAVLVSTPFPVFWGALKRLGSVLLVSPQPYEATLGILLRFAENARRNGVASLEREAAGLESEFLNKAMNLAVDGTDLREIREMMQIEIEASQCRADAEIQVWDMAAGYSPTIGIIGAVLGLIQVMKHLENMEEVGRGIAVAFVATVYGVAAANLVFLPAAVKLRARERELSVLHEMMLEGALAITEGMNPKLIRIKLESLLPTRPLRILMRGKNPPTPITKDLKTPSSRAAAAGEGVLQTK